jgi:hypothetical protein
MSSSEFDTDEMSDVIVSLNITETNITINGSQPKTFMKSNLFRLFFFIRIKFIILGPNEDSSISNILIGIGLVTVALIALVIIIKLIQMCYKMWQEEDGDKKDQSKLVKQNSILYMCLYFS